MDILTNIIAGVTALDIYYADLPDTAHSYDGCLLYTSDAADE